jgi:hypothetical protein
VQGTEVELPFVQKRWLAEPLIKDRITLAEFVVEQIMAEKKSKKQRAGSTSKKKKKKNEKQGGDEGGGRLYLVKWKGAYCTILYSL